MLIRSAKAYQALPYRESKEIFQEETLDLALVYFDSSKKYGIANLANSLEILEPGREPVFLAGFLCKDPVCDQVEFKITRGASIILPRPLIRGYQLGYDNEEGRGMSGGPVVLENGTVVGIHGEGKHSLPNLANSKYRYFNGDDPSRLEKRLMQHFAWGVPVTTYSKLGFDKALEKIPQTSLGNKVPNRNFSSSPNEGQTLQENISPDPPDLQDPQNGDPVIEPQDAPSYNYWLLAIIGLNTIGLIAILGILLPREFRRNRLSKNPADLQDDQPETIPPPAQDTEVSEIKQFTVAESMESSATVKKTL